jgi:F-type H+-transporting ATPase subunit gamma
MSLKHLKNKIAATRKTGQVTKAMESVSAVKMRKSQERALKSRPYILSALRILGRVGASKEGLAHLLAQAGVGDRVLLIIVTSDKGLAGSVNSSVLKEAEKFLRESPAADIVAFGRKAVEFARKERKTLIAEYTNLADGVSLEDAAAAAKRILEAYKSGVYARVEIVHQNFISTLEQRPTRRLLLPLRADSVRLLADDIAPRAGRYSSLKEAEQNGGRRSYVIEPDAATVLDILIPQLVVVILYFALLESKASEHSARMVAMKNATDRSQEVARELTVTFNKERQAAITAEVSEITAGAEAMRVLR